MGILLTKSVTPWSASVFFSNAGCRNVTTHASADFAPTCTYRGELPNPTISRIIFPLSTSAIAIASSGWLLGEIRGPTADAGTVELRSLLTKHCSPHHLRYVTKRRWVYEISVLFKYFKLPFSCILYYRLHLRYLCPLLTTCFPREDTFTSELFDKMGSAPEQSRLFEPLQIGKYKLQNRLIMAPLTRFRADDDHVQLPFVKEYYTQRASSPGTLLITEATFISAKAGGYPNVPGIYNQAQIDAWKEIVESVHKAGGIIFMQLWALGRTANPQVKEKEGTGDLVSSSAVPENSDKAEPRPLSEEEIQEYIRDYATAAKNAVEGAGFDGVGELHLRRYDVFNGH